MPYMRDGKLIRSLIAYDSSCFKTWSNTYSLKSNVSLVPIWQISLARELVIPKLWFVTSQLETSILFKMTYFKLAVGINPLLRQSSYTLPIHSCAITFIYRRYFINSYQLVYTKIFIDFSRREANTTTTDMHLLVIFASRLVTFIWNVDNELFHKLRVKHTRANHSFQKTYTD